VVLLILLAPSPLNISRSPARGKPPGSRILLQPIPAPSKGGGGSGTPLPASKGRLPRYARLQLTPPVVVPVNLNPKLAVEPTIMLAETRMSEPPLLPIGLPSGIPGPPSGGPGSRGGIGAGPDGGIGDSAGSGVEGMVPQPLRAGMKPALPIYKFEPEYSEQARKARIQGTVVIEGVIDEKGATRALRVLDGLGFGLDEQAIDAVKQWRFRPATRDGKPLPIVGTFHLTFRLL
jgi:protein TonB